MSNHVISTRALRRTVLFHAVLLGLTATGIPPASAQELTALPEDLEVRLARSALPEHLRDDATVYVLRPSTGFVADKRGGNGFHALVVRNDPAFMQGDWSYEAYRNDILVPIAFDAAGAKAHMRVLLDVAAARAGGMAPSVLRDTLRHRFATGYYSAPERSGISFMLSPILRAYRDAAASDDVGTFVYPHYMVYAPGVTNEDIGGSPGSGHPFIIEPGVHGYLIVPTGSAETAEITAEHSELLRQLCALQEAWCVPGSR